MRSPLPSKTQTRLQMRTTRDNLASHRSSEWSIGITELITSTFLPGDRPTLRGLARSERHEGCVRSRGEVHDETGTSGLA